MKYPFLILLILVSWGAKAQKCVIWRIEHLKDSTHVVLDRTMDPGDGVRYYHLYDTVDRHRYRYILDTILHVPDSTIRRGLLRYHHLGGPRVSFIWDTGAPIAALRLYGIPSGGNLGIQQQYDTVKIVFSTYRSISAAFPAMNIPADTMWHHRSERGFVILPAGTKYKNGDPIGDNIETGGYLLLDKRPVYEHVAHAKFFKW